MKTANEQRCKVEFDKVSHGVMRSMVKFQISSKYLTLFIKRSLASLHFGRSPKKLTNQNYWKRNPIHPTCLATLPNSPQLIYRSLRRLEKNAKNWFKNASKSVVFSPQIERSKETFVTSFSSRRRDLYIN